MTSPSGRVALTCRSCAVELDVPSSPVSRLREVLEIFFTVHEECTTTIDLSEGGGLRLSTARAMAVGQ